MLFHTFDILFHACNTPFAYRFLTHISCGVVGWDVEMVEALSSLAELFNDEHTVAAYELQSSGIIDTLLNSLNPEESGSSKKIYQARINAFKRAFHNLPNRLVSTELAVPLQLVACTLQAVL